MTAAQEPAIRTEVAVVSDAIALLVAASIIPRRADVLLSVGSVLGLTMQDLRDADERRRRGYARPPEVRRCLESVAPAVAPPSEGGPSAAFLAATAPASRSPRTGPNAPRRSVPTPDGVTPDKAICICCGHLRPSSQFRQGRKVCNLCTWRASRRSRYLRDAGESVLLGRGDDLLGAACGICGVAFRAGDCVRAIDVVLACEHCARSSIG